MFPEYDVIVVGAGHAGCEAAVAAANLGSKVLLATMNMQTIAQMSCNPAMGGIAKGQIIREIDALGGYSGIVTDISMIQFRMLNKSKGPAMWSPRAQSDRMIFAQEWRKLLEMHPNIDFWQEMVTGIVVKESLVKGVYTGMGIEIPAKSVILTSGTFLNGIIHIGEKQFGGGRAGERAAKGITEQLVDLGFEAGRMKTGTPPRIDGRSLDFSKMEEQAGDEEISRFSYTQTPIPSTQRSCYISYTNPSVHETLKEGFDQSPMFNGRIRGLGPRYCPSIEDKIDRFADRDRHQLFVEPEGWDTVEIYVNGFSSSLPEEVQYKALRQVPGFENMKMFRPGYAIEYDFFQPTQLLPTLETRIVGGLFFAGQINGTTGYEEAACQGLIAGLNAHFKLAEQEPFIVKRSEGYIGVLVDDLINKGTKEPYRMFTSRAEYRILLRQDNADLRLTPKIFERMNTLNTGAEAHENAFEGNPAYGGHSFKPDSMSQRMVRVEHKIKSQKEIVKLFENLSVDPSEVNPYLEEIGSAPIKQKVKCNSILLRPGVSMDALKKRVTKLEEALRLYDQEILTISETSIKYAGYIKREQDMVNKMNRLEEVKLSPDMDYQRLASLSAEAREKLNKLKPLTIGQASRISGVSPADVSVLLVHMGR